MKNLRRKNYFVDGERLSAQHFSCRLAPVIRNSGFLFRRDDCNLLVPLDDIILIKSKMNSSGVEYSFLLTWREEWEKLWKLFPEILKELEVISSAMPFRHFISENFLSIGPLDAWSSVTFPFLVQHLDVLIAPSLHFHLRKISSCSRRHLTTSVRLPESTGR